MAEKDKLSKEVEEQIQSLASDVYIQIEEKLTQLISTVTPKKQIEKINIEQDPDYLALQSNYQTSQNELAEKSKNLSEKIHQLEQNTSTLKSQLDDERSKQAKSDATFKAYDTDSTEKIAQLAQESTIIKQQLADEIDKQEACEQNFQVELTQNNINFTETIDRLEHEITQLKSALTQEKEKLSSEQNSLKTELNEKSANSSQTIEKLERELSVQKAQLHQEQTQSNEYKQQSQSQTVLNEKTLSEQQQEIDTLTESITVFAEQEQYLTERLNSVEQQRSSSDNKLKKAETSWNETKVLQTNNLNEQKNQIKELTRQLNTSVSDLEHFQVQYQQQTASFKQESEQKTSLLNEQLLKSKVSVEQQQKVITEQQAQLVDLDEKIKQKIEEVQDFKESIKQLNNKQSQIKQEQLADKKETEMLYKQQQQAQELSQQKISELEVKNQELANQLITEQADINLYQKEVSSLQSQVTLAQQGQENILNRFNATREKQEKDNDQVRETIKYLRDENSDMITQNISQKEGFIEQISELEQKITEYRLKFEYAQKQLTQNS